MREAIYFEQASDAAESLLTLNPFARIAVPQQQRRCPACDSIIYSRRHKLCGVCSSPLPNECLFSERQAQNVSLLLAEERAQHRTWLRRANWEH